MSEHCKRCTMRGSGKHFQTWYAIDAGLIECVEINFRRFPCEDIDDEVWRKIEEFAKERRMGWNRTATSPRICTQTGRYVT